MPFVIALNLSEKPRFVIFPKDGFDISLVHFMSTESYFFLVQFISYYTYCL